jgi:hypothetical protein
MRADCGCSGEFLASDFPDLPSERLGNRVGVDLTAIISSSNVDYDE